MYMLCTRAVSVDDTRASVGKTVQHGAKIKTMDAKLGPSCINFWGSMHFQQALPHPFGLTAAGPWHFHPAMHHKSKSISQQ